MKIQITIREMFEKVDNIEDFCSEIGLNPWCMNEGLADGDEQYLISVELAEKYGLI